MLLWNALISDLFSGHPINFLQAIGLLVLSKLFFGGAWKGRYRDGYSPWQEGMRQKWQSMTQEERIPFKKQWRQR